MKRKKLLMPLLTLATFAVFSPVVCAQQESPTKPDGLQEESPQPAWGKAVNGLQLGVSLQWPDEVHRVGDEIRFSLFVRNVGKQPIKLLRYRPDFWLTPLVVDEKGEPLYAMQQASSTAFYPVTLVVQPQETTSLTTAELKLRPFEKGRVPCLDVAPGKYRISYRYFFRKDREEKADAPLKSWIGVVASGQVVLEVAPKDTNATQ